MKVLCETTATEILLRLLIFRDKNTGENYKYFSRCKKYEPIIMRLLAHHENLA